MECLSDVGRAAPADDDGGGRLLLLEPLKSTNSRSPMRQVDTESAGSVVIGTTLISRGGRSAFRQDPCLVSGWRNVGDVSTDSISVYRLLIKWRLTAAE